MSENGTSGSIADLRAEREQLRKAADAAIDPPYWSRWRPLLDGAMLLAFIAAMTALFAPPGQSVIPVPAVDEVAGTTIRSERDLLVQDRKATALRRQEARNRTLPVYNYNSDLYFELGQDVYAAVAGMSRRREAGVEDQAARRGAFEADLGAIVEPAVFEHIEALEDPLDLWVAINYFLNLALDRLVVADRAQLPDNGMLEIRDIALGERIRTAHSGSLIDLRQLRRLMTAHTGDAPYASARVVRTFVLQTAMALARPNVAPNEAATKAALEEAIGDVEPAFVRIKAGEVLVRRGDRVTAQVQERIRILNESAGERSAWRETIAMAALLTCVVLLAGFFFRRGRVRLQLERRRVYLSLSIALAGAAVTVLMIYAGRGLAEGLRLDPSAAAYFAPLTLGTVLAALLIDARTSLMIGLALTLLTAYRVDGDIYLVTYFIVGVLVAGIAARQCRRRVELLQVGLAVAMAQAIVLPISVTLAGHAFGTQHLPFLAAAAASGALVSACALGLLPVLEHLFDEATDLRLLELASADNPILRQLALVAPGTYYASVVVGNMAEAAADVIGANGLKARVMALYHDIGKMERPSYFVENQRDGNMHDQLAPEVSARIVFAHVQDGLAIARKHRLGQPVLQAIAQHQGTGLLRTFYVKAAERQGGAVLEADFRYPGPKPRSKEAGILLLADSTEAATRALNDPTPAKLKERIAHIFEEKLADGQLDECELTFGELTAVRAAFVRVLTLGVYHNRIEYPPLPTRGSDGDRNATDRPQHRLRLLADRSS